MIARKDDAVVDTLIHRLQRDGLLREALSIRNFQHQVATHITAIHNERPQKIHYHNRSTSLLDFVRDYPGELIPER